MRILFMSHYFPPEVNAPATRTYEHCKRWVEAGHQVTVLTCNPNAPAGKLFDGHDNKLIKREVIDGIEVVRLWSFIAPNSGFAKRIMNYISSMIMMTWYSIFSFHKCDVIIATSPQFFTGWAGVIASFLKRKKFILEIRDIWPESIVTVGAMKKSFIIRILEKMEILMYKAAKHIVTVGEGYKQNIISKGIAESKLSVITNGVSIDRFSFGDRGKYRTKFNVGDKFVCSYIGTIGMAHGLEVVLEAAEKLQKKGIQDIEFWLVGDGARAEELKEEAKKKGITGVDFVGRLPKDEMPHIIAGSDAALVHLADTELFSTVIPSKIFEFMAMELPIIMGVRGEACDIVTNAEAGIPMKPGSSDELISALEKINADGRERFKGLSFVREHYNRDKLALEMLHAIQGNYF